MKKLLCSLMCAIIALGLTACGGSAPETEKAAELRAQYPSYDNAVKQIQDSMGVTAEQADDIFIVLVDCGIDKEVSYIIGNNPNYTMSVGKVGEGVFNYTIVLNDGVVSEVKEYDTGAALYPASLVESERLAEESAAAQAAETAKTVAAVMDEQLMGFAVNSQEIILLLQEGVSLYEESGDIVSLYDLASTAEDSQQTLWSNLRSIDDNDNKDYVSAVEQYIINGQLICEKLKEFLDGGSLENLSDIRTRMADSQSYYDDILSARREYLSSQGFTEDEIAEIIGE